MDIPIADAMASMCYDDQVGFMLTNRIKTSANSSIAALVATSSIATNMNCNGTGMDRFHISTGLYGSAFANKAHLLGKKKKPASSGITYSNTSSKRNALNFISSRKRLFRNFDMDDRREFENPFPDYSSNIPASSLTAPDGRRLADDWDKRIRKCITALLAHLENGMKHDVDARDHSVYTGTSGIALLFFRIYEKLDRAQDTKFLQRAASLVESSLHSIRGKKQSFLCGDAGPLALAAVIYHRLGMQHESQSCLKQLLAMIDVVETDPSIPDELLFGRVGYIYALLFIRKHLGEESIPNDAFTRVITAVVASGESLSKRSGCRAPLMYVWHDNYYMGAAHGLAGIFFILMRCPGFHTNQLLKDAVKRSIDYLITLRFQSGNYPSSMRSRENDKLVHWCHGAPGFIHMFIQAYKVFGDQQYLNEAHSCADVIWRRGLLRKGYGICHGVAGNGYAFLMLYQLTQDLKYLYRALKFAEWIFDYGRHGCRTADRPYSLFEGLAGTLYYLVDLLHPMEAEFPAYY